MILREDRIQKQLSYMEQNPDIAICGAQILMFQEQKKISLLI